MEHIDFSRTRITGGYWAARQETNRSATLWAVYHRFQETKRFEALKCDIRNGKSDIFWDSDVAKWMEGAAYLLNDGEYEQITAAIESAIDCIIENSDPNGYFNSHYLVTEQDQRFQSIAAVMSCIAPGISSRPRLPIMKSPAGIAS